MPRAAAVAFLLVLIGAGQALAEGSLTIGVADGTSAYLVEHVHPGDTIERHLRVGNTTSDALVTDVYAGAATNERGRFLWGDGHAQNALVRWTTVRPSRPRVPSQRAVDVTVTIRVPKSTAPGKHYAVVWAELPRSGAGIVNRVGMRIYVTITERSSSSTAVVVALVAGMLFLLAVSGIVVAARRRGSGRGGSTTTSP